LQGYFKIKIENMKTAQKPNQPLFQKIADIIEQARQAVAQAANLAMVHTYFEIGRMIVEEEQQGKARAAYGKQTLRELSARLTERFGKGFSTDNLDRMRNFYLNFSDKISATPLRKFRLSWSHYLVLMRIENPDERSFYEIEAAENQWSLATLRRQFGSSLYERLALSRDKEGVRKLATEGQTIETPADILKNPLTLEFLGLEEKHQYSENELENAIISKIQDFLLELGKGFAFIGRQVRFTFEEEHFRVDLVFYNRLLRCFVLLDLKLDKLSHKDLGQMQMYVNHYDRNVILPEENPTIGILLCKQKNDAVVKLTLPKDANIHAAEYQLYLPDKQLLQQKLQEWIDEMEHLPTPEND
jgi:predicted nuclease of restriction endonuclease-like (RecB) superfamily